MSKGFKVFLLIAGVLFAVIAVASTMGTATQNISAQTDKVPGALIVPTTEQKAKANQCGKTLSKGHEFWTDMQQSGDYVVVVASPDFREMTYDNREAFAALVVCYYSEGRMDDSVKTIDFRDPYTRANFGYWDKDAGLTFDR